MGRIRQENPRSEKIREEKTKKSTKTAIQIFFPMICGSAGSKSRLAKAAGAEPAGQMRDEKLHAVVPRSTFPSQNVKSTPGSDHFWKLRCRKSAHRCGPKHISRSKCAKHHMYEPLLDVEMSKTMHAVVAQAHFQVKGVKNRRTRTTFGRSDLEKVHVVAARNTIPSQMCKKLMISDHFWKFKCRLAWQGQLIAQVVKIQQNVAVL